jgi:hydroxypyruvate reductase
MIIKNSKQLATDRDKKLALSIIEEGLVFALPSTTLKRIVHPTFLQIGKKRISLYKYSSVYVIAIGKSSDLMTKVVSSCTNIRGGIVVIPSNMHSVIHGKKFTVIRSNHPIPTKKSVIAARTILGFLDSIESTGLVIFLISGGASSLVALPDGVSLKDKQLVTNLMLKSGANIHEVNCIRKHLSQVKGGRLVESLSCAGISLVMSDVIGDDLSVIASGITYCDRSTFSDAKKILSKYHLTNAIPKSVLDRINLGAKGMIPETPKKPKLENYVIATNKDCVDAMKLRAQKLGFSIKMIWPVYGDVKDAACKISRRFSARKNSCLIFGGETTVMVKGGGHGGRNQELILNLLKKFKSSKEKITVASVGTDGIDGNTCAAGAIADSTMQSKPIDGYLKKNTSYCYFKKYGGSILTGHTHTNLMDIGLVLQK